MGKAYSPDELARRTFILSVASALAFVAVVFIFIL
jgi:hypothetical protein